MHKHDDVVYLGLFVIAVIIAMLSGGGRKSK